MEGISQERRKTRKREREPSQSHPNPSTVISSTSTSSFTSKRRTIEKHYYTAADLVCRKSLCNNKKYSRTTSLWPSEELFKDCQK